jgi:exopolyphosphatase / guanosine-5'-triphosphate,3'-diphosphate pyrophosphatase
MENIIPRWEWRTFGESFGESDDRLARLEPGGTQESDELYLLSSVADVNTKIRNLLMDIKKLEQVNRDGLEQWKPVLKGSFPLPATEVINVFNAVRVAPPPLTRADYTLEQFVRELATPSAQLRAVEVHKKRTRYTVGSCMAELTEVVAGARRIRTVAIESEDPVRVIAAVRELGLDGFENVNYPRGLKQLVGMKG